MKKIVPFLCVGALVATLSFPQDPVTDDAGAPDLSKRVEALEKDLAKTQARLEETQALLQETVAWVHARAKGSKALLGQLDASEEAGFTAGINFQSRVIFLAGLRSWFGGQDQGLPGAPKPKKADAASKVR